MLDVLEAPVRVVAAPGHTADSVALWIEHHGEHGAMVTGDTILGRGTTVIAQPDGSVDDYLATLDRLETFGDARVLPGHGDELPSLASVAIAPTPLSVALEMPPLTGTMVSVIMCSRRNALNAGLATSNDAGMFGSPFSSRP